MHHGAVHSRHHRVPGGLPDHHRELPKGGTGHEVTADPPDCVHHLEGIIKFRNVLPERERGPPFTNLRKDWSASVTEKTKPENIENQKKVKRKIEIQEEIKEVKLEEEEEEDKESGSKKKDKQKKLLKYSILNSSTNICTSRASRDQDYLDGERLEMPSSSSSMK